MSKVVVESLFRPLGTLLKHLGDSPRVLLPRELDAVHLKLSSLSDALKLCRVQLPWLSLAVRCYGLKLMEVWFNEEVSDVYRLLAGH